MLFWIKKWLFDNRLIGCLIVFIGITITLSLLSYRQDELSFNTSSNLDIANYCGHFGSYLSDILLQSFGIASYICAIVPILWGIRLAMVDGKSNIYALFAKIIAAILLLFLTSGFIGSIESKELPAGFGGLCGYILSPYIMSMDIYYKILLLAVYGACAVIATGIQKEDLITISTYIKRTKHIPPLPGFISVKQAQLAKGVAHVTQKIPNITQYNLDNDTTQNLAMHEPLKQSNHVSDIFTLPTVDLLGKYNNQSISPISDEELHSNSMDLLQVLKDFGVHGKINGVNQGPVVTMYEFEPSAGTKSSRVIGLADDIARSLSAVSTRIAVIPGRNALGIELPNKRREFFSLRDLIPTNAYNNHELLLPIILGKDLGGRPVVVDLAKMPHLLVAGTTGSGKSVAINAMIISLLYKHTPETCKFIMIDPKMLELSVYDGIPHLLTPVVTEPGKAVIALKWAVKEMENRYRLMSNLGVRSIAGYNDRMKDAISKGQQLERTAQTGFDPDTGKPIYESVPIEMETLPFIVVIVDEMADLMLVAGKDIESSIQRLAQMARAAGIHIIMATQRPSVDVITGVIKANFPSRISFKVTSKIDSRTIMGEQGAEQLLGMGDMLYMGSNSKIARFHGPFVDDKEVENIASYLKAQGEPSYVTSVTEPDDTDENSSSYDTAATSNLNDDDSLYKQALKIVLKDRKTSTSYVQRSLRIGYNRAALIVERMEKEGILSSPNHTGKREILVEE